MQRIRKNQTIGPVILWLCLFVILLLLPTGFEGALAYQNADRVRAVVLSTDESDIVDTGLVRSGEQRCKVRLLSGKFRDAECVAVNRLNGSLAQDKLFAPGDKAYVVVSYADGQITTVYMTDHFRLDKEAILVGAFLLLLLLFAVATGVRAILSFADTVLLLWKVLILGLLKGWNPIYVSLGIVVVLTCLVLSLIYGLDRRCLAAVSGATLAILSGFAVGRAACGSTTTTLLLAYSGSFIALLMVFMAQGTPVALMLNYKYVAAEIVHTIVGSFGLVTVAPLTAITSGILLTNAEMKKNERK